jgi:hypothetical protein
MLDLLLLLGVAGSVAAFAADRLIRRRLRPAPVAAPALPLFSLNGEANHARRSEGVTCGRGVADLGMDVPPSAQDVAQEPTNGTTPAPAIPPEPPGGYSENDVARAMRAARQAYLEAGGPPHMWRPR